MKKLHHRLEEGQSLGQAVENTMKSASNRLYRLRKRVKRVIQEPNAYFFTFTLDNRHLNRNHITIERKIKETLGNASDYVINNDLGSLNERLHYHGVASFDFQIDYTTLSRIYKYGAINIQKITSYRDKAITEYISKLSNHAVKNNVSRLVRKRLPKYFKKECIVWLIDESMHN